MYMLMANPVDIFYCLSFENILCDCHHYLRGKRASLRNIASFLAHAAMVIFFSAVATNQILMCLPWMVLEEAEKNVNSTGDKLILILESPIPWWKCITSMQLSPRWLDCVMLLGISLCFTIYALGFRFVGSYFGNEQVYFTLYGYFTVGAESYCSS